MRERALKSLLRRLYGTPDAPPTGHAQPRPGFEAELETRSMASYRSLYGSANHPRSPRVPRLRAAFAGVLGIALLGVACEIPTRSEVSLGQHVRASFVLQKGTQAGPELDARLRQALEAAGVERVLLSVAETVGGEATLDLVAWGDRLVAGEIESIVRASLGNERLLELQTDALSGTVEESLGHRVGRRFFGLDVEQESAEALRASVLQQLSEQGFDGTADVQVQDDGSRRTISIEASSQDGSRQIEDEIILENDKKVDPEANNNSNDKNKEN